MPARADAYGLCHRRTGWLEWRDGLRLQGSRTRRQRHLGGRKEQEGHGHFKPLASQDSHRSRSPLVWQRNSLTHKYRHTHTDTLSHFIPRHDDTSLHSFLHVVNFFFSSHFFLRKKQQENNSEFIQNIFTLFLPKKTSIYTNGNRIKNKNPFRLPPGRGWLFCSLSHLALGWAAGQEAVWRWVV